MRWICSQILVEFSPVHPKGITRRCTVMDDATSERIAATPAFRQTPRRVYKCHGKHVFQPSSALEVQKRQCARGSQPCHTDHNNDKFQLFVSAIVKIQRMFFENEIGNAMLFEDVFFPPRLFQFNGLNSVILHVYFGRWVLRVLFFPILQIL